MRKAIIILTALLMVWPLAAQTTDETTQTVEVSKGRKAVGRSGDVLVVTMPLATLTAVLIEKDWTGLKQAAFSATATLGSSLILKYTIHKTRPDLSDDHSFPSAHTSVAFANAAFVQRRYGWKVGAPAYVVATYIGWSRTYAKKHDWWDVAAGAALGAGCSYIFTRPWTQEHELQVAPVSDGEHFGVTASMRF